LDAFLQPSTSALFFINAAQQRQEGVPGRPLLVCASAVTPLTAPAAAAGGGSDGSPGRLAGGA